MSRVISASRVATLVGDFHRSPAYLGLAESLRVLIGDGRIGLDVRLPSERDLTGELDVSRATVTKAYDVLRESGYAAARRGAGTFTRVPGGRRRAHDRALMPGTSDEETIDLNCAAPSAPPGIAEAYQAAAEALPAYLAGPGYFPLGVPALQQRIAAAYDAQGLPTSPDQVMVTPGALAASSIVARAMTRAGDRLVVENPTYPNATQALRSAGARLVPADVDPTGWDMESYVATLRQAAPTVAYLIADFQNPTGHLMTDEQRAELARHLARSRTVAVCDEAHRDLALTPGLEAGMPRPFATHHADTITIGSASKSFWGGLRLGWVRAPRPLMERLLDARMGLDLGAPVYEQLVLAHLLEHADDLLAVNRERLRGQRDALVAAVTEHLPDWEFVAPGGGLALWCQLSAPLGTALAEEAARRAVVVAPGPVFAVEGGLDRFVRVPWTAEPDRLAEAARRLAEAWGVVAATGDRGPGRPSRVLVA